MANRAGKQLPNLRMPRCPHSICGVPNPVLQYCGFNLPDDDGTDGIRWRAYLCTSCFRIVTARGRYSSYNEHFDVKETFPSTKAVDAEIPDAARRYLERAQRSVRFAPDAAAMVASSAVDAMLKDKGFNDPKKTFHQRIDQAVCQGLLTQDMGKWAHVVRYVSNDPRHADANKPHVSVEEACQMVDFAEALGEFLFVLPSRANAAIEEQAARKARGPAA